MVKRRGVSKMSGTQPPLQGKAASEYNLHKLFENIEDTRPIPHVFNHGREAEAPSGQDKTPILVAAKDHAGALIQILQPLANMACRWPVSKPAQSGPNKWAYVFFIDMPGHIDDANMQAALAEIRPQVKDLRVLGAYPKAVI